MEEVNRALEENGVRLYYVRTVEGQSPVVTSYLVAGVVIDEPSPECFKNDIAQCIIFVGRASPSPLCFKKDEKAEDAYLRFENSSYEVCRPVTLYSKEHAIELLSQFKTVSAVNAKWRSYYDQTDVIFERVLSDLKA